MAYFINKILVMNEINENIKYQHEQIRRTNYDSTIITDNIDFFDSIETIFYDDYSYFNNFLIQSDSEEEEDQIDTNDINYPNDISLNLQANVNPSQDSKHRNKNHDIDYISENGYIERQKNLDSDNQSNSISNFSKKSWSLTENEIKFKKEYYSIFTSRRRFNKMIVRKIHDILRNHFCFRAMQREELRSVNIYFKNYAFYSSTILNFLRTKKDYIIKCVPELQTV